MQPIQRKQAKASRTGNAEERKQLQKEIKNLQDTVSKMQAEFEPDSVGDYSARIQKLNTQLENVNLTEAERNKLLKERKKLQDSIDGIQAVQEARDMDLSISPDKDNTDYDSLLERLDKHRAELLKKVRPKANINMPTFDILSGKSTDFSIDLSVDGMDDLAEVANLIEEIRKRKEKLDKETRKESIADQYGGDVVSLQKEITTLGKDFKDMGVNSSTAGEALAITGNTLQRVAGDGAAAKAGAVMAAIGQILLGYATASAQASEAGPIAWIAFAIAGAAQVATMIAQMNSYQTGGIVPRSSYTGDKVVAHVNSGEMILNTRQQARLFAIATGNLMPALPEISRNSVSPNITINANDVSGGGMLGSGKVVLEVRGRSLVGVIDNENKIAKKIGRRTVAIG